MTEKQASVLVSDLGYAVVVGDKVKRILRKVSFVLGAGDMCAILGPSGAGKRYMH
jgi:ABC-type protease/lipase transport system fused ATPase/permease subunit